MNVDQISQELIEILKNVLRVSDFKNEIPLHEPEFSDIEKKILNDCINSTFVSTNGEYIGKFEQKLKKITSAKNVISVVNGTSALEIGLRSIGIKNNDEVFVPALTFVATANAIKHCNAIPHFVDSNLDNMGIDASKLEKHIDLNCKIKYGKLYNKNSGRRISAIIPVHVFGMAADIKKIIDLGNKYNLKIVEDAAEALGSFLENKHLGTFGKIGTLSFNGNKIITTGGGGALLTNDDELANKIRHISSTAKISHAWEYIHDEVGWNYRMPNINAALGYAQLIKFKDILNKKRVLAKRYKLHFKNSKNFIYVNDQKNCKSNYWLNCVKLSSTDLKVRDIVLKKMHQFGFRCRPVWRLLNKLPMYKNCPRSDLTNAINLEKSIINLPSSSYHVNLNSERFYEK